MARATKIYTICSLLIAFLFAYSASTQLNDHDWYFWFPLYSCACIVNTLMAIWVITSKPIRHVARVTLLLATCLCVKVVAEHFVKEMTILSLDLSERVVREKVGSGLVFFSMILQLIASSSTKDYYYIRGRRINGVPRFVEYGMATLVGLSYGLPFVFFVVQKGEMNFDGVNLT